MRRESSVAARAEFNRTVMTMNSNDRRALEDAQEAAALRDAIEKRNDREVSRMLSIGVDPNLSVDGCSMLQLALSHSLMDIARLLLEAGADADVPVAKGEGMTLLVVVAASGMLDAARMLIEFRPNPNCTSCNGWTALHYAANIGHAKLVLLLIACKADLDVQDDEGNTALHTAAFQGHAAVASALLNAGADIDLEDNKGGHVLLVDGVITWRKTRAGRSWSVSAL